MAIVNTTSLPRQLRSTDQIPSRTRVTMRCIEESFGAAKSNDKKLQITREFEIVHPEFLDIDGTQVGILGTKLKHYRGVRLNKTDGSRDDGESNKLLRSYADELAACGLPYEQIDDENPELLMKGQYVDVNIGSEEYERKAPLTPEEKAAGIKEGKPTGKKGYKPRIEFILGKAQPVEGQPW